MLSNQTRIDLTDAYAAYKKGDLPWESLKVLKHLAVEKETATIREEVEELAPWEMLNLPLEDLDPTPAAVAISPTPPAAAPLPVEIPVPVQPAQPVVTVTTDLVTSNPAPITVTIVPDPATPVIATPVEPTPVADAAPTAPVEQSAPAADPNPTPQEEQVSFFSLPPSFLKPGETEITM